MSPPMAISAAAAAAAILLLLLLLLDPVAAVNEIPLKCRGFGTLHPNEEYLLEPGGGDPCRRFLDVAKECYRPEIKCVEGVADTEVDIRQWISSRNTKVGKKGPNTNAFTFVGEKNARTFDVSMKSRGHDSRYECYVRCQPKPPPKPGMRRACECGKTKKKPRIVGGREAKKDTTPWQVGLSIVSQTKAYCGGSLITERHVLSAAHCFPPEIDQKRVRVYVGAHDLTKKGTYDEVAIAHVVIHEKYDGASYDYDYAIVELDRPVEFVDNKVKPVCLDQESSNKRDNGEKFRLTGWGKTRTEHHVLKLHEIHVNTLPGDECRDAFNDDDAVTDRMLCAWKREGDKTVGDSCSGDSGGPLVAHEGRTRALQIGIVSWGLECGSDKFPGVYALVNHPEALQFIKDNTGNADCDPLPDFKGI